MFDHPSHPRQIQFVYPAKLSYIDEHTCLSIPQ